MSATVDTWVVVPCFNEAGRLCPEAFREAVAVQESLGIIFVDDGSLDRTPGILRRLCGRSDRLIRLTVGKNRGKGEAVRRGLAEVLRTTSAEAVGYWDADLAAPLTEIRALRAVLNRRPDIDLVLGIRLPLRGHRVRYAPTRFALGRLFAVLTSILLRHRFRDTQCGAKLFRVTPRLRRAVAEPFLSRWVFDVELLLRCCPRTTPLVGVFDRVYELPLEEWTSQTDSKLKPWSYAGASIDLFRIWNRTRRHRSSARDPVATRIPKPRSYT